MDHKREVLRRCLLKQANVIAPLPYVGVSFRPVKKRKDVTLTTGAGLGDAKVSPFLSVGKALADSWSVNFGGSVRRSPTVFGSVTKGFGKGKRWSVTGGVGSAGFKKPFPYVGVNTVLGKGKIRPVLGVLVTPKGILPRVGINRPTIG